MTLIELLTTMTILAFVLTGIVAVFVSGLHAEVDMNQRFQAQQEARLALQSMRTDVRTACTAAVSTNPVTGFTNDTLLLGFCSDASTTWSSTPVSWSTWCTRSEGGTPAHYGLYRESTSDAASCATPSTAGVREADWLTTGSVFGALTTTSGVRPQLPVSIPVDANPLKSGGAYELSDQIMLRNAANNP